MIGQECHSTFCTKERKMSFTFKEWIMHKKRMISSGKSMNYMLLHIISACSFGFQQNINDLEVIFVNENSWVGLDKIMNWNLNDILPQKMSLESMVPRNTGRQNLEGWWCLLEARLWRALWRFLNDFFEINYRLMKIFWITFCQKISSLGWILSWFQNFSLRVCIKRDDQWTPQEASSAEVPSTIQSGEGDLLQSPERPSRPNADGCNSHPLI
jgi:hypothetical protein